MEETGKKCNHATTPTVPTKASVKRGPTGNRQAGGSYEGSHDQLARCMLGGSPRWDEGWYGAGQHVSVGSDMCRDLQKDRTIDEG